MECAFWGDEFNPSTPVENPRHEVPRVILQTWRAKP